MQRKKVSNQIESTREPWDFLVIGVGSDRSWRRRRHTRAQIPQQLRPIPCPVAELN